MPTRNPSSKLAHGPPSVSRSRGSGRESRRKIRKNEHWLTTPAPRSPPKIKTIRIVENPFDDIVPRITAAEKKAQFQAKLEAKQEADKREKKSRAKKSVCFLSSRVGSSCRWEEELIK